MPRLFYCDHYAIELPPGHKFPMPKYRMVRDRLERTGVFTFQCAEPATAEVVALAHDESYVQQILDGSLPPAAIRRIGFPWSPALVLRSLASVGGTLGASVDALERGWGGNLAGGTHHAFRAEGSGYCVFNDMAVAIQFLRKEGRLRRAAIVDLDVHQGDGTALIFEDDAEVLTLSIHGEKNFPFRKQRSRIDLALPDGTGDEEYLRTLEAVLPRVLEFHPEIIFYQSGVDALDTDTLGRLSLSLAGLSARDTMVMRAVRTAGIPFLITLGGGYSSPLERTAEAHANTFLNAFSVFSTPSH
ncbi:histone deacetylase family protein [Paludibaculum fermentans]|uniref:histone deacetylase family protein n=1 Tax=Paludibaculum fermentans TaxID=1473598 RepID=UPI003EB81159